MTTTPTDDELRAAVHRLGLYGLLANWAEVRHCDWLPGLLDYEQTERQRRSLERRLLFACLGAFKPMADFDWQWARKIDRAAVEELCSLEFLTEIANVVLIGPNGTGKTMIAKNLAHLALLRGHSARFTTASAMLNDLAAQDSASALHRRLRHYCRPSVLVVDELGYLSYRPANATSCSPTRWATRCRRNACTRNCGCRRCARLSYAPEGSTTSATRSSAWRCRLEKTPAEWRRSVGRRNG